MSTTFDGQPVLQVENVVKAYGDKRAVDGLSFSVCQGELLCLLGANGAGKTTTIEMCEGFITPTSGQISVLGMNPATQADAVRQRVGIMLQGGGGYTGIKVREMLKLAASYSANPHDPDWLIDILGLGGEAKIATADFPADSSNASLWHWPLSAARIWSSWMNQLLVWTLSHA